MFAFFLNVVFNIGMNDKELIEYHGGSTQLAEILGLDKARGGVQRVNNWMRRGIPPKVKLEHPNLFLKNFSNKRKVSP